MLKIKIELELILNPYMFIFFEKGTRGGISHISNRYSKTSNKYLKSYDPRQESKHYILNLIIYMVMQCLFFPVGGLTQVDLKEFEFNIAVVQKDVFSKLILNIQKIFVNYIMIIL